jgi:hypothetical protein
MDKKWYFFLGGVALGLLAWNSASNIPGVQQIGNLGYNVGAGNGWSTQA